MTSDISCCPCCLFARILARLGGKKYRSEARMIFSRQPARQGRLAGVARQTAIFAARNEDAVILSL
jgi:hypothetical protein